MSASAHVRSTSAKALKNAAARKNRKRQPAAVEHPIGCPTCGQRWHFVGDGLNGFGRYRAVHPPGPCIPRPQPGLFVARCRYRDCGNEFEKEANGQAYCSDRCRESERRAQMAEACKRYHGRKKAVAA